MALKQYSGQAFVPVVSAAEHAGSYALQEKHDQPGAVSIEVWFAIRGVRDPVMKAAMKARAKVRRATPEAWTAIFAGF